LAIGDIDALATLLGSQQYFFGSEPKGADATFYAFIAGILPSVFQTPLRTAVENKENLTAYAARMKARFFPEA
jgi:glutathione S-transferase